MFLNTSKHHFQIKQQTGCLLFLLLCMVISTSWSQVITPSKYWKHEVEIPTDTFASYPSAGLKWIKLTVLTPPYDPQLVYFQHSRKYPLHHQFATNELDPFIGMTSQTFYDHLTSNNPQAYLGTILIPSEDFSEYGIQFVHYDRDRIRDLFNLVKSNVITSDNTQALLIPTFEQQQHAQADRDWFAAQGIEVASTTRWANGNACYAQGWAMGTLKHVDSDRIDEAYQTGELRNQDILLTEGVPAEIPALAGVITLAPSTPNSHVAILSKTYRTPFTYLAIPANAQLARDLVGKNAILTSYEDNLGICHTDLIDTEGLLSPELFQEILDRKKTAPLNIQPIQPWGGYGTSTEDLYPTDTPFFGGKASNFGILRRAIPENSPRALGLSFDIWKSFLDQPLVSRSPLILAPGEHILIWADDDETQGSTHTSFKLSKKGESIALYDTDGSTLIDVIHFDKQSTDVSYGRSADGAETWQSFPHPTPGQPNTSTSSNIQSGLVINEFMADNDSSLLDPCEADEYPDWIELYNGTDQAIALNGMYLTDDISEPTKWRFPIQIDGASLREEIARRLAPYQTYPPEDIQGLWTELATIRNLFRENEHTGFDPSLQTAIIQLLTDPHIGYDQHIRLRFRSSTNVEDSEDYTGAGLYDSYSGCLADELDNDNNGPSHCDPNKDSERGVFRAIRRTMASFYNDNAYLERIRRDVNETDVGMAMVVHPSFPDELELANGVATVQYRLDDDTHTFTLVTQEGATSVTNPDDGSIPEEVVIVADAYRSLKVYNSSDRLTRLNERSLNGIRTYSSLVALGSTVMDWTADYETLCNLLMDISQQFQIDTGKTEYTLDLEYKKVAPGDNNLPEGGLVVKQVRQIPEPNQVERIDPILVGTPVMYEILSGEFTKGGDAYDVFADHRLKSQWTLIPQSMILNEDTLSQGFYESIQIEHLDENSQVVIETVTNPGHSYTENTVQSTWSRPFATNQWSYQLATTGIPTGIPSTENPFYTLADLGQAAYTPTPVLTLNVTYDQPVLSWTPEGLITTLENKVYLAPRVGYAEEDPLQIRTITTADVTVKTRFYWPEPSRMGLPSWDLNSTAPLTAWDQTTITGLTTEPIVLTGYYAQTYRPEDHNIIEHFLFEPALDPQVSQAQLEELRNKNIRYIHVINDNGNSNGNESGITTIGF